MALELTPGMSTPEILRKFQEAIIDLENGGGSATIEPESGLDESILSSVFKTGKKFVFNDQNYDEWQIIANVPLLTDPYFGSQSVYVKYIGKIVLPITNVLPASAGGQQSTFTSADTTFNIVVSPFGPNGLVTNFNSGDVEPIAFATLFVDNTNLSNEYELWVAAAHNNDFESIVTIITSFIAPADVELIFDRG
jgi:hypothetical protein